MAGYLATIVVSLSFNPALNLAAVKDGGRPSPILRDAICCGLPLLA
jgi:hypothetical protein